MVFAPKSFQLLFTNCLAHAFQISDKDVLCYKRNIDGCKRSFIIGNMASYRHLKGKDQLEIRNI